MRGKPAASEEPASADGRLPGAPTLRRHARSMRRQPTDAERILWDALRDRRFRDAKFRRQVPIGRWIADFVSYPARLIVELDGDGHVPERDRIRDAGLAALGFQVLRFPNRDVTAAHGRVLAEIAARLPRSTSARPTPGGSAP